MNTYIHKGISFRHIIGIFIFLYIQFGVYAQSPDKITLVKNQITVIDALKAVEKQTGKSIGFSDSQLKDKKTLSLNLKNVSLDTALSQILKGSGFTYQVKDNYIMIVEQKPEAAKEKHKVKKISGKVADRNGEPLIGVNVAAENNSIGTITDIDGHFTLTVPDNATLTVSYVGYQTQNIRVATAKDFNIVMNEDTKMIEEVVVTALGIKRSQKALSYNVQEIKNDAVTAVKDANFVNALNGKVAGLTINTSSSGVGGVSKVVMRGTKSIMQSSNALYVIDGVPMYNGKAAQGSTEFGSKGSTEPIADINPEDIESLSVLSGAAAAALYGSAAANGAIVITTKKGKEGKVAITVSSGVEANRAFVLPRFQTRYGTGLNGVINTSPDHSWGPHLTTENYYGYRPDRDYLRTGTIFTENITLSVGSEKNQTYASVGMVNSNGIIPNNKYGRYNINVRNTTSFLNDKMTLDVSATYIRQTDRNMVNQGVYSNPLVGAYLFPRGNDWNEVRLYETLDPARKIYTQNWAVGDAGMTMQNPYWINYRNLRENQRDRYMLSASLSYKLTDWLNASARVRMDNSNNDYTQKFYASTNNQLTALSTRGYFGMDRGLDKQIYADFLLSANKTFGEDWSLSANFGGSYSDLRYDNLSVVGGIPDGLDAYAGEPVGLTNYFVLQNLSKSKTQPIQSGWREQTQSLYASAEVGYKSTYYLTLTGRNDWPSQLGGPRSKYSSFFYPSVGASVVMSEWFPNLNKDLLSYLKVRGSYASVGNAFSRYIANPHYEWSQKNGWSVLTQYPVYDLKPERTRSFEVGLNARFLRNFDLNLTYYYAKTMNQTFNPEVGVNGYSKIFIQSGAVRNQGLEVSLGYKNTWKDFHWESTFTGSMNRNKILTLAENAVNPTTGQQFSIPYLNVGGLGSTRFILKEGGSMGDIYAIMDLRKDRNNQIYIDKDNKVYTESIKDIDRYVKLGSVLPKYNLSWNNSFSWKGLSIGAVLTGRIGGVVYSRTQAILDEFGVSEASAAARDRGYVMVNGNDKVNPQEWYSVVAGGTTVPQYYTYSATNFRLQEASIGYTLPRKLLRNICDVKISLTGRNLWMIYNKAPFDPESVASTDNFYQGIDYFMMPSLRSWGVNVNLKF